MCSNNDKSKRMDPKRGKGDKKEQVNVTAGNNSEAKKAGGVEVK